MQGLTGRDIVCLSTQDWDGLWTRKQRFMKMFAESGNRVLYVETPVHLMGIDVLPADPGRFLRFRAGPRKVAEHLHVATLPILLPMFQMSHLINRMNHVLIRRMLRAWLDRLGFKDPLYWIYTPFSAPALKGSNADAVYECVDEFRAARGLVRASVVGAMEDELLRRVRLTIVTHENLRGPRARLCKDTFCVPNGADIRQFQGAAFNTLKLPDDISSIPKPRLGLIGHIHYWIDLKLIRFLAEQRPDWSFVLVGPASPMAQVRLIKDLPNVHLLGKRPQQDIPRYLQSFDCCLNPYVTGALADHCSPLKLYEYLAAGKPVVSSEMPEARKFSGEVSVAGTPGEFLKLCETRLSALPESPATIQRRLNLVSAHSWDSRFAEVNRLVQETFSKAVYNRRLSK